MRILWLSHFVPYPPKGGCFQRSYNLMKEAAKKHEVHLVTLRHTDRSTHPVSEVAKAKGELEKFCRQVWIIDIDSFSTWGFYSLALKSLFSVDPMTVNLFKSKEMHDLVRTLAGQVRFDVVHFDTISLAEYFLDIVGIPKFLTHHGVESFMIRRRAANEPNPLKKIYLYLEAYKLRKYERKHCGRFTMNIMVSEDDQRMLEAIAPSSRFAVVENGVDVDFFSPKESHDITNRLIFAGRLDQYSNMDAILHFCTDVWPLIREKNPEMRITIIGNHPPQKLREIAKGDGNIEVLGYVDDVRPFFREATVSVCPIRDGGGTRIKILDAMAMGMPIVSTTIGCEGLEVNPGGDVLIADTPKEFADTILALGRDGEMRRKMSRNARKTVERIYSWRILGEKLNGLYELHAKGESGVLRRDMA
jgi:sugar transferase (PEP-CTERM/EpsH1 system associated)